MTGLLPPKVSAIRCEMATNPLTHIASEIAITALVVGFTPPSSFIRLTTLPLVISYVWLTLPACINYFMHTAWAGLFGGYSVFWLFQYVDVALLGRRGFEPVLVVPKKELAKKSSSKKRPGKKETPPDHQQKQTKATLSEMAFWERLSFGISVASSCRFTGTAEEVKSVPHFSNRDPTYVPGRVTFIIRAAATAISCYLVLDLMTSGSRSLEDSLYLTSKKIPVFMRLASISIKELEYRLFATAGLWINLYCLQSIVYNLIAFIWVGSGLSEPKYWRPLFGSPFQAYSIGRFWGYDS